MRVGLIADIHGNLIALEAVLADLSREAPDLVVCLGDVAATGPRPRETVERLRALGCAAVMGNADAELLRPIPAGADERARRIVEIDRWCGAQLAPDDLAYLGQFVPTVAVELGEGQTLLCFHGSPRSFDDLIRVTTPEEELDRLLAGQVATVLAGGHTHGQFVRRHRAATLLNPGSVGLAPPEAAYALVTHGRGRLQIDLRRLALDGALVARDARASGMPHADWWASFWR